MKSINKNTYSILIMLMLISTILGQTQYNLIQMILELIIVFTLVVNLIKNKYTKFELGIIYIYLFTSILSFLFNDILTFLVHAKISGLTITVILYATKNNLRNINILKAIFWIHICLISIELLTGNYFVPAKWIGGYYEGLVGIRPSGLFILPHVSITYIAIYLIYILELPKSRFSLVTIITGLIALYYSGFGTGFYALIIWYIITRASKVPILKYFTNGYILILIAISFIFLANHYLSDVISLLKQIPGSRFYSVALVLPELIDIDRIMLFTNLIPKSIGAVSGSSGFVPEGPEVGYYTLFQVHGVFLAMSLIIFSIKYIKTYKIFILLTLIHYSFYFISPFILVASIIFNKEIEVSRLQNSLQKW